MFDINVYKCLIWQSTLKANTENFSILHVCPANFELIFGLLLFLTVIIIDSHS